MKLIVAGSGCSKCKATEEALTRVIKAENLPVEVEHLYDVREIAKLGVMLTPAVVLDGKIVLSGKVPTDSDVKKLLRIT